MELRWRRHRIVAPCYAPVPEAVLIQADACRPVARIADNTGGRVLRAPGRKVGVFLMLEGPSRTWAKARAKLDQRRYLGDWHVTLVAGRRVDNGDPVIALAPCAPPAASHFLVPEPLVRPLPAALRERDLVAAADRLRGCAAVLEHHGHERYLYSGNAVPQALVGCLDQALGQGTPQTRPSARSPNGCSRVAGTATLLRLRRPRPPTSGTVCLALLGAGDYARSEILPALLTGGGIVPFVVADREPHIAVGAGRRYGFEVAATDAIGAIDALPGPGVVMVATAHDAHATLAAHAARAGHAVFVEKPAVVSREDLATLLDAWIEAPGRIEIGFNRRHAPLTAPLRAALARADGPVTIACTVREVPMRDTHWFLWPNQGTRIAGNLCHWIDFGVHLVGPGADPIEVRVSPPLHTDRAVASAEERSISVAFSDGSLLTVLGTVRGDDTRGVQEGIEVRRGELTLTMDDFRRLTMLAAGRRRVRRRRVRDKGHTAMYRSWARQVGQPAPATYPVGDLIAVCAVQLAATTLVREAGTRMRVDEEIRGWRARVERRAAAQSEVPLAQR